MTVATLDFNAAEGAHPYVLEFDYPASKVTAGMQKEFLAAGAIQEDNAGEYASFTFNIRTLAELIRALEVINSHGGKEIDFDYNSIATKGSGLIHHERLRSGNELVERFADLLDDLNTKYTPEIVPERTKRPAATK